MLCLKILLRACSHMYSLSPPRSLNVFRMTCSCNTLKILLLLIAFIWILITSRNCSWDCTSLSVNSRDFLGWTVPRNTIWTNGRKKKVFLFYSFDRELKYRNCSSFKVIQNLWKQLGTETLSLESQTVPKWQFTFDHQILPQCSVLASPRWQLVECHKCSSAAKCSSAQLQLTAALPQPEESKHAVRPFTD